jgi:hypothetical protein
MKVISPILFLLLVVLNSCSKTSGNSGGNSIVANVTIFGGVLSGANEVPPNNSSASGNVTVTFNNVTKVLKLEMTYSGMTPILAHIHKGDPGVVGPEVFTLGNIPYSSPVIYTSLPLSAAEEADLFGHHYYVNIHSTNFIGGEIRTQLIKK